MPRVALFVLVALLTVSCEGPIGPTGPQGSGGPQGQGGQGVHKGQGGHRGPKERRASRLTGVRLLRVRISRTGVFGIGISYTITLVDRVAAECVDRHRIQCRVLQCPLDQCPCRTGAGGGTCT